MYHIKHLSFGIVMLFGTIALNAQTAVNSFEKFKTFRTSNYDSAIIYARETVENALKENDSLLLIKGNNSIGWLYTEKGNITDGIKYYKLALELAILTNNTNFQIYLTNNLGNAYDAKSDYDRALQYHLESLELRQKYSDEKSIGISKNNIGLIYYRLRQYDKALEYFNESLLIDRKYNQAEDALICLNNIGLCYLGKENYQEALKTYDIVLSECKNCPEKTLAQTYNGLGIAYYNISAYSIAIENFKLAEKYATDLINKSDVVVSNYYLASIYLDKGELSLAK